MLYIRFNSNKALDIAVQMNDSSEEQIFLVETIFGGGDKVTLYLTEAEEKPFMYRQEKSKEEESFMMHFSLESFTQCPVKYDRSLEIDFPAVDYLAAKHAGESLGF